MQVLDAPGEPVPGFDGRYRLDRDGVLWSRGRNGRADWWTPKKRASVNTYKLTKRGSKSRWVYYTVDELIWKVYGGKPPELEADAPEGKPIPGFHEKYLLTPDGRVWIQARGVRSSGARGRYKKAAGNHISLQAADGGQRWVRIADLYREVYGRELESKAQWQGVTEQVDANTNEGALWDEYSPPLPMTENERWDEPRRVVWPTRNVFGYAVGSRGHRWFVRIDGERAPRLFVARSLMLVPDQAFERRYKQCLKQLEREYLNLGRNYASQLTAAAVGR